VVNERRREELANPCPAGPAAKGPVWKGGPNWASWAPGLNNSRFQSAADAGLTPANVRKLVPKWVFAFPDTAVLRSQPAVYRRRIFAGAQDGTVYALDAATGCVHRSTTVLAEVRSGITVAEVAGGPTLFFGDSSGYVYALDGETGKQVWKLQPEEHPASKATATPVFYQGRLYIGISSLEEALAVSPDYVCCTFRGSVAAVQAADGKVLWKRYMIAEAAKPRPRTKRGSATTGPSGVGVWNAPTLDPDHDTLYIGTGDNYARRASLRSAPDKSASLRSAPLRSQRRRYAFTNLALYRWAPRRIEALALTSSKFVPVPSRSSIWAPTGLAPFSLPRASTAARSFVSSSIAPLRFAPVKSLSIRIDRVKSALERLASTNRALVRSSSLKEAPSRCALTKLKHGV
jgi:hypothetical protein